jgi:hypothetical protein
MRNQFYFQIKVTQEQVGYTKQLVEHSMQNHKIPNIWDGTNNENRTVELRFTGSLGEVVFADTYGLKRPTRSFGADDGQDLGRDFQFEVEGDLKSFDIKSMRRKNNVFYSDYVLNIPSSQLNRLNSLTDYYFHINLHEETPNNFVASFVGYAKKEEIVNREIGIFYKAGSTRTRGNGTTFTFFNETYEVDLKDFTSPPTNDSIKQKIGYAEKKIK